YFINAALRWFGGDELADKLQRAGQWEKGEQLAQLIRQTRTLLILDGLEPVQHPPLHPDEPEGGLKEQTMQSLLRELAAHQLGLCVISTRVAIADLVGFEGRSVIHHPLDELSPPAGAQLLRQLKVNGAQEELEAASEEYGGHSLALTLLGSYLGREYAGDVRRRHEIESLEKDSKPGWQARRMFCAYEKWLGGKEQARLLEVLRMMGLFNRPADAASIAALRAAPAIAGLTDSLFHYEQHKRWFGLSTIVRGKPISEREWRQTIATLRDLRLLAAAAPHDPDTLDAHPLVREHFCIHLKAERPDAWRAGNVRLYRHLTQTAKLFPDTLDEMAPLFAAVAHGCDAGMHQIAFYLVYCVRILRAPQNLASKGVSFSTQMLGAFDADLAVLTNFFVTPWHTPVAALKKNWDFIFNAAGFRLMALGRLREAVQPMQSGLNERITRARWKLAAQSANTLSQLFLILGNLPQAIENCHQSLELA
ncbi:MAG: hypothetical protein ACRD82_18440, partial [Blastocatellia bacterium]